MNTLFEILPLLIPVLLIDIALAAMAVSHILRHAIASEIELCGW